MKILSFTMRTRNIEIIWLSGGEKHTTMLYRHSDYTWHPDADTLRLLPKTKEELQRAVIAFLSVRCSPEKKAKKRPAPRNVWFAENAGIRS